MFIQNEFELLNLPDVNKLLEDELAYYDLPLSTQSILYEWYCNSGEMPYGTMKARDGDPDIWITDRLVRVHQAYLAQPGIKGAPSVGKVVEIENRDQDIAMVSAKNELDKAIEILRNKLAIATKNRDALQTAIDISRSVKIGINNL